jgi:hypothetical protein
MYKVSGQYSTSGTNRAQISDDDDGHRQIIIAHPGELKGILYYSRGHCYVYGELNISPKINLKMPQSILEKHFIISDTLSKFASIVSIIHRQGCTLTTKYPRIYRQMLAAVDRQ